MNKFFLVHFILLLASTSTDAQSVRKIILDNKDKTSGYYLAVEPDTGKPIEGVLVLLSGFSQQAESIFPETKLQNVAYANNILTVGFAAGYKLTADSIVQAHFSAVLRDVISRYKVSPSKFVLGGYSAGGAIVLRYAELCVQFPAKYPIAPKGVFMVDAPIDLFTTWDMMEKAVKDNFSEAAVEEAKEALFRMKNEYGLPTENIGEYATLDPFSMNKEYGDNEKYLQHMPVRAYHDVDIAWRLVNRRQTVHGSNYEITAELIYRLLRMGNDKAEFVQSERKGYRSNGMRHPHSWSIVEEVECIQWMKGVL